MSWRPVFGVVLVACAFDAAAADAKDQYERRVAERYVTLFKSLDRDTNGAVSRREAQGDLNFPQFDDMDINRDGIVTEVEMQRYIQYQYGQR
ncbi:MAG: hypothetical protein ACXWUK_10245 [Burkholderiales bacterium]